MDEKRIAACGNDCAACPRYTARPFEKTEAQLRHTAELWMRIGYRDHIVSNEEIACSGCDKDNWCRFHIAACAFERGVDDCGACDRYPCETIAECFRVTESFRQSCKEHCTEREYALIGKAFFEKKENLERHRPHPHKEERS